MRFYAFCIFPFLLSVMQLQTANSSRSFLSSFHRSRDSCEMVYFLYCFRLANLATVYFISRKLSHKRYCHSLFPLLHGAVKISNARSCIGFVKSCKHVFAIFCRFTGQWAKLPNMVIIFPLLWSFMTIHFVQYSSNPLNTEYYRMKCELNPRLS